MTLPQLSDEQIRTWSVDEKDRWWLENVYKGDMPQLTLRSALTGMLLGGALSLTNLYVGAKTGWTLGVGITSVILAFTMWKVIQKIGVSREFTVLENNCMQSIATAAGYMTAPLVTSLAAYMIVTDQIVPLSTAMIWMIALSILGVLFAFPLKRRFINDEQMPFPEGRAAGIVMDALHHGKADDGVFKGVLLSVSGLASALLALLKSEYVMCKVRLAWLTVPEYLDGWIYRIVTLRIGGIDLRELTIRPDTDVVMMAAGGLMGIRTGVSLLVGALINYVIVAPLIIAAGDIHGTTDAAGVTHYGFKAITMWALWCGAAMMTTASLFAFFSKWRSIVGGVKAMLKPKAQTPTPTMAKMKGIELPFSVFAIGIPLVGAIVVYLGWTYFKINPLLSIIAIPLVFVFSLIAANSTALTSVTPTGALGKLTQLTFGLLAPGNITTNLMTAGITGEVAGNASNLLMDIKPGYMLGAKPRQQAIGHVLGIIAGALASVPIFYLVFLKGNPQGLISEKYPMPGVVVWKAVAEVLTRGLDQLPVTARFGALFGALAGIILEAIVIRRRGRFPLTPVAIGLAFVLPFYTCLAMFLGSFFFWCAEKVCRPGSKVHRVTVENQEPLAAGVIAGGALMGIAVIIWETFGSPCVPH